uniref:Uncharacterized protein n=1 Tax=Lepeophtheirus salmonis TaxID=72036 RepID=A0A0K2U0L6_LEPSM
MADALSKAPIEKPVEEEIEGSKISKPIFYKILKEDKALDEMFDGSRRRRRLYNGMSVITRRKGRQEVTTEPFIASLQENVEPFIR